MNFNDLKDLTKDDVLAAVGLSVKRSTTARVLEATGFFGAGLLIGAAAGLLLAPKSGKGLREELGDRFRRSSKDGEDLSASGLNHKQGPQSDART